jgi:ribosomal protein S18 acetylase RimI-like enzyme
VGPPDVETVARALALAFRDDPVASWCFPDDARRARILERGYEFLLRRIWLPAGECLTTDRLIGTAGWLPPGGWRVPLWRQLALMPNAIRIAGRWAPRFLRLNFLLESKHAREPHWYVAVLGVEPEWQGRGFGSHLLRPGLERCDREGLPAYLEASSERNRALYERHGFEVTEELALPRGGPPLWLMWRAPRGFGV